MTDLGATGPSGPSGSSGPSGASGATVDPADTASILTSIKKLLGIAKDYTNFDMDIILHINSALSALVQMGVGTPGVSISDDSTNWADFMPDGAEDIGMVTSYVYLRVKIVFDSPSSAAVLGILTQQIEEYSFRLNVQFDLPATT